MSIPFGKLERIQDIRTLWPHEAQDFTPWLANNLSLLGETIGLELEVEATEQYIGDFKADILARDFETGSWVIIENQLEATDHTHLGQLLTYAAGLKAKTLIWIATAFTDEHRAALDWLNEVAHGMIVCFGLEIEVWAIDGSLPAPRFTVRCSPNAWVKRVAEKQATVSRVSSVRQKMLDILSTYESMTVLAWIAACKEAGISKNEYYGQVKFLEETGRITREDRQRIGDKVRYTLGNTLIPEEQGNE